MQPAASKPEGCVLTGLTLVSLASCLTSGMSRERAAQFADEELEIFKELCVFWQDIHSDSVELSAILAKAVCALSALRVHLRDHVELKDIEYNPLSRWIPGQPIKTVYDKLLPRGPPILERKRDETRFYGCFIYSHRENLLTDKAFMEVLLPAHTVILDGLPNLLWILGGFNQ